MVAELPGSAGIGRADCRSGMKRPHWSRTDRRGRSGFRTWRSGHRRRLFRGLRCRLENAYLVPERVADAAVNAVEMFNRLLRELDAARQQRLVRLAAVVG